MADINRLKVVSVERYGKKNPVIRKNRRMEENKMIIYTSIDGQTKIDVRLEDETLWLTQAQMCELYQTSK